MEAKRRKIVFIINSLAGGGAERVLINLIGYLENELSKHEVHLVLLDDEPEWQTAPAWVEKHVLDAKGSMIRSVVRLTRLLRRISPDLTLSFLNRGNCANIFASKLIGCPCVISERVHTSSHFPTNLAGTINRLVVRLTYPWATEIIAVSAGIRQDLIDNFGVRADKVRVAHNPIDIDVLSKRAAKPPDIVLPDSFILGVGRLVPNKNFELLIKSYEKAGIDDPLIILGEGVCRESLETLVQRLGLTEKVRLAGYVNNPYPVMRRARFLVSSSNAEGFPNSLVEAMTLGCPVVATDCETGPKEILGSSANASCDGVVQAEFGILSPMNDSASLSEAIMLMARPDIRARYVEAGQRRAEDYSVESSRHAYLTSISTNMRPFSAVAS